MITSYNLKRTGFESFKECSCFSIFFPLCFYFSAKITRVNLKTCCLFMYLFDSVLGLVLNLPLPSVYSSLFVFFLSVDMLARGEETHSFAICVH